MSGNNEDRECPLCLESLELDDLNFFPCACGYQICRFCWHRIRTNENGLCPACRKQYSEDPANFKPLTVEELQQIKNKKKQKDLLRKQKISENRKHLANVRVVQKNLVFVVGLPYRLSDPEELKKNAYFGKFGKTLKVIVNHTTTYAGSQGPSASAYVTYQRVEDALRAIQSINNSKVEGRTLKASLGTTKYCSNFLKKLQCPKQDCMYLHELGDDAASFTKEDMQAGLHQEYERRLHEQVLGNSNQSRKQSSPVNCSTTAVVSQKEQWPSPKAEQLNLNKSSDSPPFQKHVNSQPMTIAPSLKTRCKDSKVRCSTDHVDRHLPEQIASNSNHHSVQQLPCSSSRCTIVNSVNFQDDSPREMSQFKSGNAFCQKVSVKQFQSKQHPFENCNSFDPSESDEQCLHNGMPENSPVSSVQYERKFPVPQANEMVNGFSHNFPVRRLMQSSGDWSVGLLNEDLRPETMCNGSSEYSGFSSSGKSVSNYLFSNNRSTLNSHTEPSIHDGLTNGYPPIIQNSMKIPFLPEENSALSVPDDDLGFDPWHESSKGLADLVLKEADERAKSNGIVFNRSSSNINKRLSDSGTSRSVHTADFSNFGRQMVPPPGFTGSSCTTNSTSRPAFPEVFPSKLLPVMSAMCNNTSAEMPQHQREPHVQLQRNCLSNNMLNLQDADIRPQIYEFQDTFINSHHKNGDLNFSSLSQEYPHYMQRVPSSTWNTPTVSEMLWQQQQHEQAVNRSFPEGRNISPTQVEKMLQQLKLSEQVNRFQNHVKYNSISSYRGGSS